MVGKKRLVENKKQLVENKTVGKEQKGAVESHSPGDK